MLSAEQLRCFAQNGYVVVTGVIDEAVLVALDAEVDAMMADD